MHILEVLQPITFYGGHLKPLFLDLLTQYSMCHTLMCIKESLLNKTVSPNQGLGGMVGLRVTLNP